MPKTVIFVIDRSGSMAGKKIEQARRTLKSVLNNLRDDDLFNIVAYDDRVESFRPELQRYGSRSREEAERFVENIREGGSTNIDEALKTALGMIQRPLAAQLCPLPDRRPADGRRGRTSSRSPSTAGRANERRARVFCFGVGYDVNARLLDRLSGGNAGTSEYVKPDEDIEAHVGRFYSKMTSPVLTDIRLELSGVDINRTYPRDLPDLFEGGQLVVAGRYRQSGRTTIRIAGKVGDERRSFEFPAELAGSYRGSGHDFVERLWAVRRVGDLIDQIDMNGQNRELVDELVALSRKYGLLTPYTSFLADENVPLHADVEHQRRAGGARSRPSAGRAASRGRAARPQAAVHGRPTGHGSARLRPAGTFALAAGGPGQSAGQRGERGRGRVTGLAGPGSNRSSPGKVNRGRWTGSRSGRCWRMMGGMGGGMGRMMGVQRFGEHADAAVRCQATGRTGPRSRKAPEPEGAGQTTPCLPTPGSARSAPRRSTSRTAAGSIPRSSPRRTPRRRRSCSSPTDYFRLAREQKAEYNQYFSQDEPVTVKLDGQGLSHRPRTQGCGALTAL